MAFSDPGNPDAVSAPKLASVVARRIEDDVAALGWPVGSVLWSESELVDRFRVSRAVLREAVRIVEHTGVAQMRRGPGGGLAVTEPSRRAVVTAMGVWFSYVGIGIGEIHEVRYPIMVGAVRLAAERRTTDAIVGIGATIDEIAAKGVIGAVQLIHLETEIVAAAGNPALALFIESLGDLGTDRLATGRARLEPPLGDDELRKQLGRYRKAGGGHCRR